MMQPASTSSSERVLLPPLAAKPANEGRREPGLEGPLAAPPPDEAAWGSRGAPPLLLPLKDGLRTTDILFLVVVVVV